MPTVLYSVANNKTGAVREWHGSPSINVGDTIALDNVERINIQTKSRRAMTGKSAWADRDDTYTIKRSYK